MFKRLFLFLVLCSACFGQGPNLCRKARLEQKWSGSHPLHRQCGHVLRFRYRNRASPRKGHRVLAQRDDARAM